MINKQEIRYQQGMAEDDDVYEKHIYLQFLLVNYENTVIGLIEGVGGMIDLTDLLSRTHC